ncbi:MAG: hypothetical protein M3X11_14670 [Acidobacteriota bacterium]|nr:hypothetical protein [Acidobacteriota bacterium]
MLKQSSKLLHALLIVVFAGVFCLSAIAQNQAQPAAQSSTRTKKSGASITCDGALDIVPAKTMSFVRKRRPNKTDGKQQNPPADSKPQPKPPSNSKSGR